MESIIKVSANDLLKNKDDVVVIEPIIPPSEIPYFVILNSTNGKITIKNEYLPKNEVILHFQSSENLKLYYGKLSGRVYEVNSINPQKKEDLINSIIALCRKILKSNIQERFIMNLNLTSEIIIKSIKKSNIGLK